MTTSAPARGPAGAREPRVPPRRVTIVTAPSTEIQALKPVLHALAARGHRINFAVAAKQAIPAAQRLTEDLPTVEAVALDIRRDEWTPLADALRSPRAFSGLGQRPVLRSRPGRAAIHRAATWLERAIPTDAALDEEISALGLDLVVATAGPDMQLDWLLSARRYGMRTALLTTGWSDFDAIHARHVPVDRAFVWNEEQRRAGMERLGLPADHVVAVGAAVYDAWLDRPPPADRTAFLTGLGLPADRPAILYAAFLDDADHKRIRGWIRALRESAHPELREASLLVRLRPDVKPRRRDDLSDVPNVAVVDRSAIPYADCVVTVDPRVAVESALAARPGLTVPGFAVPAALAREHGGPLVVAATLEEHVQQVAEALRGPASAESFVHKSLRPHGPDRPVAPLLADAIEDLLAEPCPRPAERSLIQRAARPAMWRAAQSPRLPEVRGVRRAERAGRMPDSLAQARERAAIARNRRGVLALNDRHLGETVFVVGASAQLNRLDAGQIGALSRAPAIGLNRTQYRVPTMYFLSTYTLEVALALRVGGASTVIHLCGEQRPMVPGTLALSKRTYEERRGLPRRLDGDRPVLYNMRNASLGATHLAVVMGARQIVYVGIELRSLLHFYAEDSAVKERLAADLQWAWAERYYDDRFADRTLEDRLRELRTPVEEQAAAPYWHADHTPALQVFFAELERHGVEPIATSQDSAIYDAGARYVPLDEAIERFAVPARRAPGHPRERARRSTRAVARSAARQVQRAAGGAQ
jgi:hypothetical protein